MANELSVELSYEDIRTAMVRFGFHIEVPEDLNITASVIHLSETLLEK